MAELKTTFVHCGPRASASAWVVRPPSVSSRARRSISLHRRRAGLERAEPGVAGGVVADHAGRDDRAGGDDGAADDARHQLGDDLLVAEAVLQADDGRVGEGLPRAGDGRPGVQRLGRDEAEVAVGEVAPVGSGVHGGGEVGQPGDRSPSPADRVHVRGPGVDDPDLDLRGAGEVRGVQAADRAAADNRHPERVGAAHDRLQGRAARSRGRSRGRPRRRRGRPPGGRRRGAAARRAGRGRVASPAPRRPPAGPNRWPGHRCRSRTAPPRPRRPGRSRARRQVRRPSGPAGSGRRRGRRPRPRSRRPGALLR